MVRQPPLTGRAGLVPPRGVRSACGGRRLPAGVMGVRSERTAWARGRAPAYSAAVLVPDALGVLENVE
ncbi:hypothetical protein ACWCO9_34450, partial [Streptomyces sp. NPDC001937]